MVSKKEENVESDESFEVDEILDKRIGKRGIPEYLIKWYGYSDSENTWEPIGNINAPELLKKFEENHRVKRRNMSKTNIGNKKKEKSLVRKNILPEIYSQKDLSQSMNKEIEKYLDAVEKYYELSKNITSIVDVDFIDGKTNNVKVQFDDHSIGLLKYEIVKKDLPDKLIEFYEEKYGIACKYGLFDKLENKK